MAAARRCQTRRIKRTTTRYRERAQGGKQEGSIFGGEKKEKEEEEGMRTRRREERERGEGERRERRVEDTARKRE